MIAVLAELLRLVALVIEADGSMLPAVVLAGAVVSAAVIVTVLVCAGLGTPAGASLVARVGAHADVLVAVRQSDPAEAGHPRSRAPGEPISTTGRDPIRTA